MSETISYKQAGDSYKESVQAVATSVGDETLPSSSVAEEELKNRLAALDAVTNLVAENASVVVRCSWLSGAEVTLSEAMNAYPSPMIDEDPILIRSAVLELLANRVVETEEQKENKEQEQDLDPEEEKIVEPEENKLAPIQSIQKKETEPKESAKAEPEKTVEVQSRQNTISQSAIGATKSERESQPTVQKKVSVKSEQMADKPQQVKMDASKVRVHEVQPRVAVSKRESGTIPSTKLNAAPKIEAPENSIPAIVVEARNEALVLPIDKARIEKAETAQQPQVEIKLQTLQPDLKISEINLAAKPIPNTGQTPPNAEIYVDQEVETEPLALATQEINSLELSEPVLAVIGETATSSVVEISTHYEESADMVYENDDELDETEPENFEGPTTVQTEIFHDHSPLEPLFESKQEPVDKIEPLELLAGDYREIEGAGSSPEFDFAQQPEFIEPQADVTDGSVPVEMTVSEPLIEKIDITVQEVEDSLVRLVEILDNVEPEVEMVVNDTLDKIIDVIEGFGLEPGEPDASDEFIPEDTDAQEDVEELFIELFEALALDYSPSLIESLAGLIKKWQSSPKIERPIEKGGLVNVSQDPGTHEIIMQLLACLSSDQRVSANAYIIGSSTLRLCNLSLAA